MTEPAALAGTAMVSRGAMAKVEMTAPVVASQACRS